MAGIAYYLVGHKDGLQGSENRNLDVLGLYAAGYEKGLADRKAQNNVKAFLESPEVQSLGEQLVQVENQLAAITGAGTIKKRMELRQERRKILAQIGELSGSLKASC